MPDKLYSDLNKGAWSSAVSYTIGDFVNHNGSSYTCIANHTNQEPPNATYWALIAQKGTDGAGDVVGPASSVASEIALFDGVTGKLIKSAIVSGIAKVTSGVLSVVTAPSGALVGTTGTQTLINKRIRKRVNTIASSATPTPNGNTTDIYTVTALAVGATFGAPTGTPVNGQGLIIRILDNGTGRSLAYNAIYRAVGVTLPTTTVADKTIYLGFIYNSADTKWDCVAVAEEA